jgi:hypothetical protein
VTCLNAPQDSTFPCTRYSTFGGGQVTSNSTPNSALRQKIAGRSLTACSSSPASARLGQHDPPHRRISAFRRNLRPRLNPVTQISAGIGIVYDATPIFLIARPYAGTRQDTFFSTPDPTCIANCITTTGPVS